MKGYSRCLLAIVSALLATAPVAAQGPKPAISDKASAYEQPLFSRHIVPLFSRLGCNLGGCHGAVQGKNGFRLSLFGAEPALDHQRILREFGGRRLNLGNPDQSLLLLKATAQVSHEGGKRIDVTSPYYQMLRTWIAHGAPLDKLEQSQIRQLEVTPQQQTVKSGEAYALRVVASFSDGSKEDVTGLCTFESREDTVAEVNPEGQVSARGVGSTAIVVRFRGQPVVAGVLVPGPALGEVAKFAEHNFVDKHVLAKLRVLNIQAAPLCDDATFLRRLSLDVNGALPTPEEIRAFTADSKPGKRSRKIDELLQHAGHGAVWATKFSDLLKPQFPAFSPLRASHTRRFYEWLRARIVENTPYDQLVERIVLSTTAEGRSSDKLHEELKQLAEEDVAQ